MLSGLSIVIPAFNEQATLREVVEGAVAVAPRLAERWEVIVVNDGSQDASGEIARQLAATLPAVQLIEHPANRGFGASQRTGILASREPWVTVIPSDGQFDPRDLERLAAAADDCDIVIGTRHNREDSLYRRVKTRVFCWTVKHWLKIPFTDINWVKLYRRSLFDQIAITSDGIGIEAEVIRKAMELGCRFQEALVGYAPRRAGQAKGDQVGSVLITIAELVRLKMSMRRSKPWQRAWTPESNS